MSSSKSTMVDLVISIIKTDRKFDNGPSDGVKQVNSYVDQKVKEGE